MSIVVYDWDGNERDMAWAQSLFGNISHLASQFEDHYQLVRLDAKRTHESLVVKLLDVDGNPVRGISVIRHWMNMDPKLYPLPPWQTPPERYFDTGVVGKTKEDGTVGFPMGHGDQYNPSTQTGATWIWIGHKVEGAERWGSDMAEGLGYVINPTIGELHLDCTFQQVVGKPEPPIDPWTILFAKLDAIIELLEKLVDK